jgi:hypothetical protein
MTKTITFNKKGLYVLSTPVFLICLALLLANDLILKDLFHNGLTGKLSDFCGLFIFPVFFSVFFPKCKKHVYVLTALLFVWWKSPLCQPAIELWNHLSLIRVSRTLDYSDLFALLVLPLSYAFQNAPGKRYVRISPVFPLIFSAFAFMATSYQKDFTYNKTFRFAFSKDELVRRINSSNIYTETGNLPLSLNISNANDSVKWEDDSSWYYSSGFKERDDTLYVYKNNKNTSKIDTVYHYRYPMRDTMYISKSGCITYQIIVSRYMEDKKINYGCPSLPAKIRINGNDIASSVSLIKIHTSNCLGMFDKKTQRDEEANLLRAFESGFISRIKTCKR